MSKKGYGPEGIKTVHWVIEASADPLDPRPQTVRCDVAGTAEIVDPNGTSIEYNLVAGELLPFSPYKITAIDGAVLIGYI